MTRKSRNKKWNRDRHEREDYENQENYSIGSFWIWLFGFMTCYIFVNKDTSQNSKNTYYDFIDAVEHKCYNEIELRNELLYISLCFHISFIFYHCCRTCFGRFISCVLACFTWYILLVYQPFQLFSYMKHYIAHSSLLLSESRA